MLEALSSFWSFTLLQLIGLVFLTFLFQFIEQRAALRGTKGEDNLPTWVHRCMRLVFLVLIVWPVCVAFPLVSLAILAYLPSFLDLSELNGGRPSEFVRSWPIWNWVRWYFSLKLVKTVDLDPKQRYLIALEPHGILPFGGVLNLVSGKTSFNKLFPGIELRGLAASFCFYLPCYRELVLAAGICDASRYSADRILRSGKSLFLVPGGASEALYASPTDDNVLLKRRLGFIRLALKHGASIVPAFSFNESETYEQFAISNATVSWIKRKFQNIFGLSLPLVKNILPRSVPIVTVVGRPLPVPQLDNPTDEQVQKYLDQFIANLEELYRENAPKYNTNKTKKLVVL